MPMLQIRRNSIPCLLGTVLIFEGENRIWSLLFKDGLFVLMVVRLFVHNRLCFLFFVTCLLMHVETLNFQWHQLCNFEDVFVLPVSD